jgi:serpin B
MILRNLRCCLPVLALAGTFGCSDPAAPGDDPWRSIALDERIVHAYTDFGLKLFGRLAAEAPDSNLFLSSTSAAFALAMTYNGAAGETQASMARTLGIEGMSRDEVNRANREWLETLEKTGRGVELSLANSLWIRQGYPMLADFLERNRGFYRAEVQELDFASPAAPRAINDWVSRSTRGKIDRIVDGIPGNVVMYLINALYFKGDWTYPFDRRLTQQAPFTLVDGTRKTVAMMSQRREFAVLRAEGFQAVSLPYGNGRFSMVLVLPDEGTGLTGFYAALDAGSWERWMRGFRDADVVVSLPRFKLEWEESLNETLKAMGMEIAFGPEADFTAMSPRDPWIDEVKQKTFLEVNEEGTVAAAVTSVAMFESAPPELRFDRPFFLAIRDNATETLLFVGQVTDPS